MKNRIIHIAISILALSAVLSLASCRKIKPHPEPEPYINPDNPYVSAPFKVEFDIKDGLIDVSSVVSKPVVKFTLSSDDESANYAFTYSVADGGSKTVKSIWDGSVKDLSASFAELREYGSYSLKGTFVDIEDATNQVVVDTVVWMKYVPIESISKRFVTASREEQISSEGAILYKGESGVFELAYTPSTTFLNLTVSQSNTGVISLDQSKAVNKDGVFSIPFTASTIGETTITFSAENGPENMSFVIPLKVVEDTEGKSVTVEMEHSGLALPQVPLSVTVTGHCSQSSRLFNIEYFIDATSVKKDAGVSFDNPIISNLSADTFSEGKHTLLIRVSSNDGRLTPIEKKSTFEVAKPILCIRNNNTSQEKYFADDNPVNLPVSDAFTISVKSIPEAYQSRFRLIGSSYDTLSGTGPWSLIINRYGRGNITLVYSHAGADTSIISLDVLRTDNYNLRIGYTFVAEDTDGEYKIRECFVAMNGAGEKYSSLNLSVSGRGVYYGVCYYLKALSPSKEGGFFNEECEKREQDQYLYYDKTAVFSSEQQLFDASWYASNISQRFEESEYWPDWAEYVYGDDYMHAEPERGQFPYRFVMESVSLAISSENDEGLTYVIHKDTSMSGIMCFSDKPNVRIK